jgi:hypothetical protein
MGVKKYRVTINNESFSYTVVVEADESSTMKDFEKIVAKKVKEQYGADIPDNVAVDMEFEIVG